MLVPWHLFSRAYKAVCQGKATRLCHVADIALRLAERLRHGIRQLVRDGIAAGSLARYNACCAACDPARQQSSRLQLAAWGIPQVPLCRWRRHCAPTQGKAIFSLLFCLASLELQQAGCCHCRRVAWDLALSCMATIHRDMPSAHVLKVVGYTAVGRWEPGLWEAVKVQSVPICGRVALVHEGGQVHIERVVVSPQSHRCICLCTKKTAVSAPLWHIHDLGHLLRCAPSTAQPEDSYRNQISWLSAMIWR